MQDAVVVQGLGKQFCRYHAERPVTLKAAVLQGLRRIRPTEKFWALRNISFSVTPGRTVGVIGTNGSGKSTLLRLIGGIGRPDQGKVKVRGRIGALIDLGAGFHPDLTGRENVFISGIVAGLTRREVAQRFESIVAFAELQEFIDNPLRTYSTGMQMRLGFAVAVHTSPEILLIDEFLSVGDLSFQRKCHERIAQFKAEGCAIVIVSHDLTQMQQLCDEMLWLRKGEMVAYGEPEVVVGQYVAEMTAQTRRRTPRVMPALRTATGTELRVNENRFGSMELEVVAVRLLNRSNLFVTEMDSGDFLCVEMEYLTPKQIHAPIFGITVTCADGQVCVDTSTTAMGLSLPMLQGRGLIKLYFERLDLNGGEYFVDVGAYERDWTYAYDYHWHVYPLLIHPTMDEKGILYPPRRWELGSVQVPDGMELSRSIECIK